MHVGRFGCRWGGRLDLRGVAGPAAVALVLAACADDSSSTDGAGSSGGVDSTGAVTMTMTNGMMTVDSTGTPDDTTGADDDDDETESTAGTTQATGQAGSDTGDGDTADSDTGGSTAADTTSGPGTTGEEETTTGAAASTGDEAESSGGFETTGSMFEGDCTNPLTAVYGGGVTDLDIIFVVDDTNSMGLAQRRLALAMDSFSARLDDDGVDYRIGITSTDVGNPWCASSSEAGQFVASSCRERLEDFVFAATIDVTIEACLSLCEHDEIDLLPTTTDLDPIATPRPWIERIDGETNLPVGVSPAEAMRCMIPQGIAGCGFEQPLEAGYRAVARAQVNSENQYGFFRDGADVLVVYVTNEVDCSYNPDEETIFLPDGLHTFWSIPDAGVPSSAVCWNAGTACVGGPGEYDDCQPANYDEFGMVVPEDFAVMHPVSRYVDQLEALEDGKVVNVAVLTGVGPDYQDGGDISYADSKDIDFQNAFGIAPGCNGPDDEFALPPVRLRAVGEAFIDAPDRNLYSLCGDFFCEPLEAALDDTLE